MMNKKNVCMFFTILILFSTFWFSCKNPLTNIVNNQKENLKKENSDIDLDITEIKIGTNIFLKGLNLDKLEKKEIEINSPGDLQITVKANKIADFMKIFLNDTLSKTINFDKGQAIHTININENTAVKIQITDLNNKTCIYSFTITVKKTEPPNNGDDNVQPPPVNPPADDNQPGNDSSDSEKTPVEKIELISSDSNQLQPDGSTNYVIKLLTGSEYQIQTKVLPENSENKELSFSVPKEWNKFITVSETGLLTVFEKPFGSNQPYVNIESTNGVNVKLRIDIDNKAETIIENWQLTGNGVDTSNGNNIINISQGNQGEVLLNIIKRSPHISYQCEYNTNHIEMVKTSVDNKDEYKITVK